MTRIARILLFNCVALLCSSVIAGEPIPDVLPIVNDGRSKAGNVYVEAFGCWHNVFHSTDRPPQWPASRLTPREAANLYGGLLFHNPMGRPSSLLDDPRNPRRQMDLACCRRVQREAAADPNNAGLVATADIPAFIEAATKFKDQGYWLGFYFGASRTLLPLPGQTPEQWAVEAESELMPFLLARPDYIGFDNLFAADYSHPERFDPEHPQSRVLDGPEGGMAIVIRRLQRRGIQVAAEPAVFEARKEFHGVSLIYGNTYLESHRLQWSRNGVPYHPREAHPGRAVRYITTLRGMSDTEKWAAIDQTLAEGDVAGVSVAQLPEVRHE